MLFEQSKMEESTEKLKITEQKKEIAPSLESVRNAENVLRDFLQLKPKEKVLLLTDKGSSQEVVSILKKAVKNLRFPCRETVLEKETERKEIQDLLKEYKAVINLQTDHFKAVECLLDEDIEKFGARAAAIYDIRPEVFKEGGALTEKLEDLEGRLDRMEALLKKAAGFKITSAYGTDLEVGLRPFKERRWIKDIGIVGKPGHWENWPGGEIFTVPDERKVNGTLVLPVLDSLISPDQGVDEFIYLKIKDGKIVSIKGGESAEKLRKELEMMAREAHEQGRDPRDVYQCAEIAFGANSKARSAVADPDQPYNFPGVTTVETEKRLGTMHLAFGDTKLGEQGAEGFVETVSHYDFVIPRNGLTVEMFAGEEDFKNKKNGRKIINRGSLNYF